MLSYGKRKADSLGREPAFFIIYSYSQSQEGIEEFFRGMPQKNKALLSISIVDRKFLRYATHFRIQGNDVHAVRIVGNIQVELAVSGLEAA